MHSLEFRHSIPILLMLASGACCLTAATEQVRKELPIPPDTKVKADIWIEGETPAAHNMSNVRREDTCWGGKFLFLNESILPATGRFFANYTFMVEKKGRFLFYGAIQRPQVKWSSPVSLAIDDGKLALLTDPGTKDSWGLSRACTSTRGSIGWSSRSRTRASLARTSPSWSMPSLLSASTTNRRSSHDKSVIFQ